MTAQRDLTCPMCRADLSMEQLFSSAEAQTAFNHLARISIPIGARVLAYLTMFTPGKNSLTLMRKVKLINELLPDLQRQAIARNGRDWAAPLAAWNLAIEQMEASRDAGRLQLPLSNHAYLYTILQGLADKHERTAEEAIESTRRAPGSKALAQRNPEPPEPTRVNVDRGFTSVADILAAGQARKAQS